MSTKRRYLKKQNEKRRNPELVRFAIPRNSYSQHHIDYNIDALNELYINRKSILKVKIIRGAELKLRPFQTGLKPDYS